MFAYVVGEEADCYAYDEDSPEDMQTLQNHQKSIEKVVAKEGFIDGHWVNPRTVNNPAMETKRMKEKVNQIIQFCNNKTNV